MLEDCKVENNFIFRTSFALEGMNANMKSIKIIIILIIMLMLGALGIIIYINVNTPNQSNQDSNNLIENTNSEENIVIAREEIISTKTETTRMKNYLGQFFTAIESKNYQEAYSMLFDSFKENYFKTLEEFEEYFKNNYPQNIVLNYKNVDRQGDIYILTVEIVNGLEITNKFEQRFVIQENDLNDFNISFQVQNSEE